MSRTLSLRGQFSMADNARMVDHEIFRYEANDLTRGWVVEEFYIWPASNRAEIGTADGQYQMCTSLATDTIGSVGFDAICDAADTRQIAWVQAGYQLRSSSVSDFLANSGNAPNPARGVVDPEHVVANGLWINAYSTSDSSTSPVRLWNYMVILRAKKMDPKETILYLIKNVAQDVVN